MLFYVLLLFIVAVAVLFKTNYAFNYYFKYSILAVLVMLSATFTLPVFLLRPRNIVNFRIMANIWRKLFEWFGIRFQRRNEQYIQHEDPCIIVANHQSSLDMFAMLSNYAPRCSIIVKKELLFMGPFGVSAWLSGTVFIDRLNHEKAKDTLEKTAQYIKDQQLKVWVFPEGTRNSDNSMLPFKKGAFNLAVQAQVPIVPVVFSNFRHFFNKNKPVYIPGDVIVTCLPPISTVGLTAADVPKLTEEIREKMLEVFHKTTVEVEEYARKIGNTELLDIID